METSSCTLEVTALSGEDLRLDRKSLKKNAYMIVKTDPFNVRATKMDDQGGSYPSWNEKLVIEFPMHARFITLEVRCKTSSGDRIVGTANAPVSDFIGGHLPENYLHCLSYRLRDEKYERNGIINISIRVRMPVSSRTFDKIGTTPRMKVPGYACSTSIETTSRMKVPGYACSTSQPHFGVPIGRSNYGGVVTGVPVWSYQKA